MAEAHLATGARVTAGPFVAASLIGAALIFMVQPMFAKMATPLLGGAPAVWNVSLVCFQAALLAGYGYAHLLTRAPSIRLQVIIHAVVLVAGLICLPLHLSTLFGSPDPAHPTLWLIGTFAVSIAPPFVALSATAPLVQHWYACTGLPDAADPYHLYAASNFGSLAGLAAYPLLLEPFAAVNAQAQGWMAGYLVLGGVLLYAGWSLQRAHLASPPAEVAAPIDKPSLKDILTWLALAFVPSSLLVGATTHITTDVAAAPFLWAPPLMLYLVTFILAFSKGWEKHQPAIAAIAPLFAGLAFLLQIFNGGMLFINMFADLAALFLVALACHGELSKRRPHPSHLTYFYLIMSLGGVLGGAFNALLAPALFDSIVEYPLMLAIGVGILAVGKPTVSRLAWILLSGCALALIASVVIRLTGFNLSRTLLLSLLAPAFLVVIVTRRAPLAGGIALLSALVAIAFLNPFASTWQGRSFFGVLRVVEFKAEGVRILSHGTTMHGAQNMAGDRLQPLSYYATRTPIGQTILAFAEARNIAVVGLGAGSTACHAKPGQTWTYYEIDPLVVKIASDPEYFTFLSSCMPNPHIVLGDARIQLAHAQKAGYDLVLLDAFSSDTVPAHLLTVEAMQLYLDKLTPEGVLIVHVSNRHMNLAPVVARVAAASGAKAIQQFWSPPADPSGKPRPDTDALHESASEVVVVSRSSAALERLSASGQWKPAPADGRRPWTDDYTNTLGAIFDRLTAPKPPKATTAPK